MWLFGSPGRSLMRANYEPLRSDMIAAGYFTQQEFDQDLEGLGPSQSIPRTKSRAAGLES
jgi:hypothetical protein